MQTTYRRADDLVQQEYLVVDRVGRLQLPPDYVDQMRRNGLAGLASADFSQGQVTIRPAGRPDAAPTPVQVQPEPDGDREQPAPQADASPGEIDREPAPQEQTEPVPVADPHALFRRPPREDSGE